MRRFIYYIPGADNASAATLEKAGLLERFATFSGKLIGLIAIPIAKGPDGGAGVLLGTGVGMPDFSGEKQHWAQAPGFWCAIAGSVTRPGPEHLQREAGLDGYLLKLCDKNEWIVPKIVAWSDEGRHVPNFPRSLVPETVNGHVTMRERCVPQFRAADALATKTFARFVAGKKVTRSS